MTFKSSAAAPLQAGRFDQAVKMKIDMISDHIKQQGYTSEKFYSFLDKDGAGEISLVQFIDGMAKENIEGLSSKDFVQIFEAIDVDGNGELSINEFALYIVGAELKREERIKEVPFQIKEDIERQIRELFQLFDEDGNNKIDKKELMKTY